MSNIVEFKNVYKKYGKLEALKGIDIEIPRGKIVGLLGPNGSGKTTMIKMMNGLKMRLTKLMMQFGHIKIGGIF